MASLLVYGRGCTLANTEPFMNQEKITNADGTPTDYFIRFLRMQWDSGNKNVKFPVTSVNGMTGDVVLDITNIFNGEDIDYDLINKRLQELFTQIVNLRVELINLIQKHVDDYHKYAFQGFMSKGFGDERMFESPNVRIYGVSSQTFNEGSPATLTLTLGRDGNTILGAGIEVGDDIIYDPADGNDTYKGSVSNVNTSGGNVKITFAYEKYGASKSVYKNVVIEDKSKYGSSIYVPNKTKGLGEGITDATNFRIGSDAGEGVHVYTMFSVEKTFKAKRIFMQLRASNNNFSTATFVNDGNTNFIQYQWGIAKAGRIFCDFVKSVSQPYAVSRNAMNFPGVMLWRSPVYDTRNLLACTGSSKIPNVAADESGRTTQKLDVASWDVDLTLHRGVYFVCQSARNNGTGSANLNNKGIGYVSSNDDTTWNTDSSQSLCLTPQLIGTKDYGGDSFPESSHFMVASGFGYSHGVTQFGLHYIKADYDFPLQDNFAGALNDNSIKPLIQINDWSDPSNSFIYNGYGFSILAASSTGRLGGVAFAGQFVDREPGDTW